MSSVKNHRIRSKRSSHTTVPFSSFQMKAQKTLEERIKHGLIPKKMQNPLENMSDEKLASFVELAVIPVYLRAIAKW